jgi:lambda family phage tail tape measure protein
MDTVAKSTQSSMGASSNSVDEFRRSLLQSSIEMQKAALAMGSDMQAANEAIMASCAQSEEAIKQLSEAPGKADFKSTGEKISTAIGAGIGVGIVGAQTAWDKFMEWTKAKAIVTGLVIGAVFAAVGLGAIYTAYKIITGSLGFIVGLLTGESYKSESIDALIEANDQVKEIQNSLYVTAQQASATNAAIAAIGIDKGDYITVFKNAETSVRANTDALDRLGIKYKDAKGNLLPLYEVVKNVNEELNKYTVGWDRNSAATEIGIGTAEQVAAAATLTKEKIAEAAARLNDYNLGIGDESQAAVKRYEDAMRDFNRETDLTSQGFKRAWADQIMPILTDFAEFFKTGFPFAVNVFRYSMATITSLFYGLKTVVYMVSESIVGSISAIGLGLEGVAIAGVRVLKGDFSGATDALVSGWTDAKARLGLIGDNIVAQARHNADAMRTAWALDDRAASAADTVRQKGKTYVPPPKDPKKEAVGPKDPFTTAMDGLNATQAGIDYVIKHFNEFEGKVRESKSAMAEFDVTMGKFSDRQRESEGFSPLTSTQKADYIAKNKMIEDGLELERQMQVLRKFDKSTDQFAFKEQQQLDIRRQDIEWMGKGQVELAKLTEARRIDGEVAALIFATNAELGKKGLKITDDEIASIYAKADAAKLAAQDLIQKQFDKSQDPWFNVTESIRKYGEEAANVGGQIGNAMSSAFKSAEDAMVTFLTTGKIDFKSFATSILADLDRIIVKEQLAKAYTSLTSGGAGGSGWLGTAMSFLGMASGGGGAALGVADGAQAASGFTLAAGFAGGGEPPLNVPSMVGEKGPELFIPRGAGTIIPNDMLHSGKSSQSDQPININVHVNGNSNAPDVRRAAGQGAREALAAFSGAQRYA